MTLSADLKRLQPLTGLITSKIIILSTQICNKRVV